VAMTAPPLGQPPPPLPLAPVLAPPVPLNQPPPVAAYARYT
jgi:hypothetical protein